MAQNIPSILVVDDNAMSRKVIQFRLARDGYEVVAAVSGQDALEVIEREPIGLVFLDLLMDGMSGSEVLATLKQDERFCDIPVVIVSGVEDPAVIDECIQAGARDFLPKPVMAETLKEVVADLFPTSSESDTDVTEPTLGDLPLLDPVVLAQLSNDYGTETAERFLARFEELSPAQHNDILEAQNSGDTDAWRRATSCLKGNARTLGLTRLAAVCRNIERACDTNNVEAATAATGQLDQQLADALATLHAHTASA